MKKSHVRQVARMAALALTLSFSSWSHSEQNSVPGEYVVQMVRPDFRVRGFEVIEAIHADLFLVRDTLGRSSEAAIARLKEEQTVEIAEPNLIYRAGAVPNDPDYSALWGLKNQGVADSAGQQGLSGIDVGAERAWDYSTGSRAVIVAVIDTGVDFTHPDLAPQAWTNDKELNGKVGVDDDGNGLVDDINGYNFAGSVGNSVDDNGHGSHCAGTIGAKGNDGKGLVGVNWDVRIMAVKFLDKSGSGTLANAVKSIDYARKMGAHIMSNSWGGGGYSAVLENAIKETSKAGILFTAAAGNDANDNDARASYPASYNIDNIVAVAAIDNRGALASFSNYGAKTVHVAAPGVNIVSTVPGGGYASYSGTSMATPHVSGIAALMLARNPALKTSEIKATLIKQSRPLFNLRNRVVAGGVADAYYALSGAKPPADPNDPTRLSKVFSYKLATAHPYKENTKIEETIRVPGASKMAIHFRNFETEVAYDAVSFYSPEGTYLGSMSGKQTGVVTSPLIHGDTVIIKFSSDESLNFYGFDIEEVHYD